MGLPVWKLSVAVALFLVACTERVTEPRPPRFSEVGATQITLTSSGNSSLINGAFLGAIGSTSSSGTGVYHSFVRVSSNGVSEQGYNTSGRPLQYDENSSPSFTKDLPLNRVPLVQCGAFAPGEFCREFDADINQTAGATSGLLDLLRVRLFISTLAGLNANSSPKPDPDDDNFGQSAASTSLVWDLDGGVLGDVYARFNYNLNPGSGKGDVVLLVPISKFPAAANAACQYNGPAGTPNTTDCTYLVYLYSQWGTTDGTSGGDNNDGFEEWSTKEAGFVTVTKTANTSFTRTHDWDIEKSVTPTSLSLIKGESGDADYTVQVIYNGPTDSDWGVAGTITIHNPSGQDVTISSVSDVISGGGGSDIAVSPDCGVTFPHTILQNGADLVCSYSSPLPDANQRLNTATVFLSEGGVNIATANIIFSSTPTTEIDESACITDTNKDSQLGCVNASDADNTPTYTYTLTFTCNDDAGNHPNTATITTNDTHTEDSDDAAVLVNCGQLKVTKDAATSLTRTWNWTIAKSVTPETWNLFTGDDGTSAYEVTVTKTGSTDSDWKVTGSITVESESDFSITVADVTDVVSGSVAATVDCGVTFPYALAAHAALQCTYTAALPDGTDRTNTATAKVTDAISFSGTAPVSFASPTITEVNASVDVTDSYKGPLGSTSDTKAFTYDRKFTCDNDKGKHDNTASINTDPAQEASASVTVNCYAPKVTKDAATSFTRTWTWTIDKTIDPSCFLNLPNGDSYDEATHTVTIQSTEDIDVCYNAKIDATSLDDEFEVTGNITVTNPNPALDAIITALSDVLTGPVSGTVDCGSAFPITVAKAGGELKCTYSVSPSDATGGTNKATATLENHSYASDGTSEVSGSSDYDGSASVAFSSTPTEETDECVNVTDLLQQAGVDVGSKNFGTYCANQPLPKTFSYKYSFGPNGIPVVCGDNLFDNTAKLTTNDTKTEKTDDEFVKISVQCVEGCTLTLGYWKTHNNSFSGGASKKADPTWNLLPGGLAENTIFFLSGQTWFEVFWTKPQGNAYYILADQYMAAVLNGLAGADQSTITTALAQAKTLFETYTPSAVANLKGPSGNGVRQQFLDLANTLDQYNQGVIGPGHCTENVAS